jgi:hypothetical protein
MGWYWKAMLTAMSVVVLTKLGQRAGRQVAGIVAALPITTAPSLLWLADEYGTAFAAHSAIASVGACAMLAAFALAYAYAARRRCALVALAIALAACAMAALPAMAASVGLVPSAGLALAAVAIATRALPRGLPEALGAAPLPACVCGLLSGAVAAVAAAASPVLGSLGSGIVASMPVTGAALAANAHVALGPGGAQRFLAGYVRGLPGRAAFGAVFALGVSPCGAWMAAGLAGLAAIALAIVWRSATHGGSAIAPSGPTGNRPD